MLEISATRQQLEMKSNMTTNVQDRKSFKGQLEQQTAEMESATQIKASRWKAAIPLREAVGTRALRIEGALKAEPSAERFRTAAAAGGSAAQAEIRKAGVSDSDREYIVAFLRGR